MLLCDSSKLTRVGCICPYTGDEPLTWTQAAPLTSRPTGQNIRYGKINNQWITSQISVHLCYLCWASSKAFWTIQDLKFAWRERKKMRKRRKKRVVQWWEHSPPTNVARIRILASTPYVGCVCCWFSPLLREVFHRVLRFPLSLKNSNSIWNAQTRFNEFLSTPKCSGGEKNYNYNYKIRLPLPPLTEVLY